MHNILVSERKLWTFMMFLPRGFYLPGISFHQIDWKWLPQIQCKNLSKLPNAVPRPGNLHVQPAPLQWTSQGRPNFARYRSLLQRGEKVHAPRVLTFHGCANFWIFGAFLKVFAFFCWIFLKFLYGFEHFLHKHWVLIFQAQSFACAVL